MKRVWIYSLSANGSKISMIGRLEFFRKEDPLLILINKISEVVGLKPEEIIIRNLDIIDKFDLCE